MKFLAPAVTCILTSHMKPFLHNALHSLNSQTRQDFQALVVDSGAWRGKDDAVSHQMAGIYREWQGHPMVEWVFTGETPGSLSCPVSVATNLAIRAGLVRGRYVCHFYDDDVYAPQFMEQMAGYLDANPDKQAVWCSQDRVALDLDGNQREVGRITAYDGLRAGRVDCQVDGGQVMYRREVLDALGDPWMPESADDCRHSDGLFLERLVEITGPLDAIPDVLMTHRFTPLSTYTPS